MTKTDKMGRRLSSWKEIAEYLGWDERTCLRWEKNLGLPIHRINPESKRSRVFAYAEDLDRWLAGREGEHSPRGSAPREKREQSSSEARSRKGVFKRAQPLFFVAAAAGFLTLGYFAFFQCPGEPADFTIRGSSLVILDEAGRELWSYDTGVSKLQDTAYYRKHFQNPILDSGGFGKKYPYLIIRDINNDGRLEVIFTAQSEEPLDMGPVVCFDCRGRVRWTFEPGCEMTYGSKVYSDDYYVEVLEVCDLDGDGRLEVVVVANQIPFFPTQIAVLDAGGELWGEYWNVGRLSRFEAADLDGDGRKELVFGGKNNEYRKPCLVILNSENVRGGSPQASEYYRSARIENGAQRRYILFPRTEIDEIEDFSGDVINGIQVLRNGRLAVWTKVSLICYEIEERGQLTAVRLSDTFRQVVNRYRADGRIAGGELDEVSFTRGLAAKVLYYDGLGWKNDSFLSSAGLDKTTGDSFKLR